MVILPPVPLVPALEALASQETMLRHLMTALVVVVVLALTSLVVVVVLALKDPWPELGHLQTKIQKLAEYQSQRSECLLKLPWQEAVPVASLLKRMTQVIYHSSSFRIRS
jgi:hypothetical protein